MAWKDWLHGIGSGNKMHPDQGHKYRMAIVKLNPDETNEAAWERHVAQHPDDIYATIRIFNRIIDSGKSN